MTRVNTPVREDATCNGSGPLSMISMLAISVGLAAAPVHAQDRIAPGTAETPLPVQADPGPVLPLDPVVQPRTSAPAAGPGPAARPMSTVTPTRADDLASEGGFDAATAAPEALAQIERERQARKAATATAAAASTAATETAVAEPSPALAAPAAIADSVPQPVPATNTEDTVERVAVIPMVAPVEETAADEAMPSEGEADWGLLAALAAMLGVGSAGAYAATRRRRGKTTRAAALDAAIMPELRRKPTTAEARATVDPALIAAQATEEPTPTPDPIPTQQSEEDRLNAKLDLAEFVAALPPVEAPHDAVARQTMRRQRRVAPAPRPYLAESDLIRPAGYFTAHVDAMPTPQNPFLTRRNRAKRARYLDDKLAERKASMSTSHLQINGTMQVSRPKESVFA